MPTTEPQATLTQLFRVASSAETTSSARLSLGDGPHGDGLPVEGDMVGGHYLLGRLLGQGRFGRVHVATRTDVPEHRVALKVMARVVYAGRNVERELVMLAASSHPNIVQLKDHGVTEDYVWLTMPLYRGETLADRLGRGTLGLREAHEIFVPVARAVEALHAAGLRHQDIKPENLFLAELAGHVHPMLRDLGVAVELGSTFVAGTALYGAPEQILALSGIPGAIPLTERMDTYGLATTLLRALVGPEAFPGENAGTQGELARAWQERETEPLAAVALPELTGRPRELLQEVLRRWLAHGPEERATMAELAADLDVLLEQEREAEAVFHARLVRQKASLQRVRLAAAALLLCGLGVAAFGYSKRETWRLAGELERARALGAASFDQLDTCVAAHELARLEGRRCAEGRRAEVAKLSATLSSATGAAAAQRHALEQRLATAAAGLRECEKGAKVAAEAAGVEAERQRAQWDGERRSWQAERTGLEGERDEQRRAAGSLQASLDRAGVARDECRADLAQCVEDRDACTAAPAAAKGVAAAPASAGAPAPAPDGPASPGAPAAAAGPQR
ncbi:MAG: serine/threonine protein kinase [Deltaproteobacteria bacterium]|nr:serine/threonine protein kinase [Deltaproteobacteria bacterium]